MVAILENMVTDAFLENETSGCSRNWGFVLKNIMINSMANLENILTESSYLENVITWSCSINVMARAVLEHIMTQAIL